MRVYCDSSALIKRVIGEAESDAVVAELSRYAEGGHALVASALAWIEVTRAVRSRRERENPSNWNRLAETAMSGIAQAGMDDTVIALARRLGPGALRSLGAVHLATAVILDVDIVVSYDSRLLAVATEFGFATATPR